MKKIKLFVGICLLTLAAPRASQAVITFTQLADNVFVVSHRVKFIGSRGQAMKLVYTKAASLCVAAGYTHLELAEQESQAGNQYEVANASVRVKFFLADGEGRLDCVKNANQEHVTHARNKLAKMGYQAPGPETVKKAAAEEGSGGSAGTPTGTCTIEQIVTMAKAGLSIEQITAACPAE
ncbi:MAG: hypothetical protein IH936_11680 [Acidobacteria bacterium]|nr:hypothetical protein [Acidobacteriota bacterium]